MRKKSNNVEIAVFLMGAFIANAVSFFIFGDLAVSVVSGFFGGVLSWYFYSLMPAKKSEEIEDEWED